MTLDEVLVDVRNELNEPSAGGFFSDYELTGLWNRGQDLVGKKIVEADQNYFEQSDQTLAFIAQQEEYPLPGLAWDRKISRVTRTDLAQPKQLSPIRFQDKERYHAANVFLSGSDTQGDVYYLRNNLIGIKPTPQMTYTPVNGLGNILIHFIQNPHEIHFADALSPTSTTFVIPTQTSSIVVPRMRAGRMNLTPNYYVNARIRFVSVNGVVYKSTGQEVTITAFNNNSRVVTFTPPVDFTDIPCSSSFASYVILSAIPVEYHDVIFQFVVWRAAKKKGDQGRASEAKEMFTKLWDDLVNTIEPRRYDENQHVRTPVDMHFD